MSRTSSTRCLFIFLLSLPLIDADDVWSSCPEAFQPSSQLTCRNFSVPVNYSDPNSEMMNYHITKQTPSDGVPITSEVWILPGGPGETGIMYQQNGYGDLFNPIGAVVYFSDHRGVGMSGPPLCANGLENYPFTEQCMQYMIDTYGKEYLLGISISNAARDLNSTIELSRSENGDVPIFIYGMSYGTVLLDRYLQLFPDTTVDGVIMDGTINPLTAALSTYDLPASRVGDSITASCSTNEQCTSLFGGAYLKDALKQVVRSYSSRSACAAHPDFGVYECYQLPCMNNRSLQGALNNVIFSSETYYDRLLVAPLVYRFQRCNESLGDVTVWNNFLSTQLQRIDSSAPTVHTGATGDDDSPYFNTNWYYGYFAMNSLIFNELYVKADGTVPSDATVHEWLKSSWSRGSSLTQIPQYETWQKFDMFYDAPARATSHPSIPVLILNGNLDIAATYPQVASLHPDNDNVHFVSMPLVGHVSLNMMASGNSASAVYNTSVAQCPLKIVFGFMSDPTGTPDTTCIEKDMPSQFSTEDWMGTSTGVQNAALSIFGTSDVYNF